VRRALRAEGRGLFEQFGNFRSHVIFYSPANSLLHRRNALAQARLVAGGGVAVQRALLDGLVERGHRLAVGRFGGGFVAFFDGLAQGAQRGAQAGGVGAIGGRALRGLTGAFERRKVICHVGFVPLCVRRDIPVGTEYVILRD